jgi:hypothetical protein
MNGNIWVDIFTQYSLTPQIINILVLQAFYFIYFLFLSNGHVVGVLHAVWKWGRDFFQSPTKIAGVFLLVNIFRCMSNLYNPD